jgi:hypothetical protein
MTTKPSNVGLDRGIYSGPFDAFTNYMNILGDFINRVNALYPQEIENDELNALLTTIRNQGDEIEMKDAEITRLKARLEKYEPTADEKPAAKKAPKRPPPRRLLLRRLPPRRLPLRLHSLLLRKRITKHFTPLIHDNPPLLPNRGGLLKIKWHSPTLPSGNTNT